jgi:hypothetical protein
MLFQAFTDNFDISEFDERERYLFCIKGIGYIQFDPTYDTIIMGKL